MAPRQFRPATIATIRVALARGPIVKRNGKYWFGRRTFDAALVFRVINEGEAVRRPDGSVVAASPTTETRA